MLASLSRFSRCKKSPKRRNTHVGEEFCRSSSTGAWKVKSNCQGPAILRLRQRILTGPEPLLRWCSPDCREDEEQNDPREVPRFKKWSKRSELVSGSESGLALGQTLIIIQPFALTSGTAPVTTRVRRRRVFELPTPSYNRTAPTNLPSWVTLVVCAPAPGYVFTFRENSTVFAC